jgi:hypothetical protein
VSQRTDALQEETCKRRRGKSDLRLVDLTRTLEFRKRRDSLAGTPSGISGIWDDRSGWYYIQMDARLCSGEVDQGRWQHEHRVED